LKGERHLPALKKEEAVEQLAVAVEKLDECALGEVREELFPEKTSTLPAAELVNYIRTSLLPEEIVDLWNVVFPDDHQVWFDDEENTIHYNEDAVGYVDVD